MDGFAILALDAATSTAAVASWVFCRRDEASRSLWRMFAGVFLFCVRVGNTTAKS